MLNETGREIKKEFQSNEALCVGLIGIFQLIANKCRFRIVCTLTRGEFCVNDIAEIIGETKVSNISQHLKMLRLAGLISSRREEKRVVYRLADDRIRGMVEYFRGQYLENNSEEKEES
ncbi:metalloregulator ArsR/SmtB family transcription factor [Opitutia bacterium ISCC 51]|nr:metalloregulator ArsR/SmtB family transcription factor [Opitutae bacterium ISCC 51]QXD29274.1 metalloregulator ArsR/SmtB family transcription factor [Opitutae bacterium ISCC 52]